ncbi:unnamed protein product [Adineta steineri]|uniref:Uncharacterized protein n=1 Tax=Adineta steineri TaxID=433720 RepID=A0A815J790_9BILA|nr:unnamed protein product [Adineta steineri]
MHFHIVLLIHFFNFYLEEEIDGATLARLPYDEVRTLFPKLKDRILFTEKRDLLIKQCDNIANEQLDDGDILNQFSKQIFDTCTTSQAIALTQDLLNNPSLSSNNMNGNEFDAASNIDDEVNHDETDDLEEPQQHLPTDFAFSSLPEEIQIYVSTIMDESDVEQLVIVMKDGIENGTINNDELITLWKKTFGYLRSFIRSHTINEILDKFPGYSYTHFVNDKNNCGYYVPIERSIQNLLNKPDVINYLINNVNNNISQTKNDPDLMLTYRDGTAAKDNPSLKLHPNSFLIQLYSDGIGITNLLSPKKDKHKLTLYYFLLEDLPDFDLNHLQTTGLVVQTFNGQLHFAFSLFAADNLASHEIGGFQQNFNSGQFCRLCHISYKFRLIPLTAISFLPRTVTTHDAYDQQAVNSFNTRPVAGVVGESPLSTLIAFHAIKSLPNDLMHDYAEEEEIDGATLVRLPYDEVRTLFPKLKDRVLFTEQRDLLIKQCNNIVNEQLGDGDILNQSSKQIFDTCSA